MGNSISQAGYAICTALSNTINHHQYDSEIIYKPESSKVSIISRKNQDLAKLVELFPQLCQSYNLKTKEENGLYSRVTVNKENRDAINYEFFIDAVQFHTLLMNECEYYRGYRQEGGSMLDLAFPGFQAVKDNTLCLFPVVDLGEGSFIPRNAGCNMQQVIQTQLAYHVNKILLNESFKAREDFYSHYGLDLLKDTICASDMLIVETAFKCLGITNQKCHQQEHGIDIYTLEEKAVHRIVEMDSKSREIYSRLGATTAEELDHLDKSIEIPLKEFVEALKCAIDGKRIYYEENCKKWHDPVSEYDLKHLEKLDKNKKEIQNLLEKL